jgi:allophanate hydrolase
VEFLPACPTIDALLDGYRLGRWTPVDVATLLLGRMDADTTTEVWISRMPASAVLQRAAQLTAEVAKDPVGAMRKMPLLGIPFAVKDNIDVAGLPTTAACPAFAYSSAESAKAVQLLEAAGAIVVGKTNLDQFATGLVGTRSPYGEAKNPFNATYVSGGSSSGSALAVALGQVPFALGTDTAGSCRVPAAFCNIVGLKPTPGLVSNHGMVPACRTLDCVGVFAHTVSDAWRVLSLMATRDDPYIKAPAALGTLTRGLRLGVPSQSRFGDDKMAAAAFDAALAAIADLPRLSTEPVDMAPLHAVAALLYDGPWIAERRAALGRFFDDHGHEMDRTVRQIIAMADGMSAADAFKGQYRLAELKAECTALWDKVDALIVPTTVTMFTSAEIAADPFGSNMQLGIYTNFVNLLGLSALALPGPFRGDGLPAGVTLIGPGGADQRLAELGRLLEPLLHKRLGISLATPPHGSEALSPLPPGEPTVEVAVVGAHLAGLPLNWQLLERSARLLGTASTTADYRLYGLPGTVPPKPGLIRMADGGASIAVEIWEMPLRNFGSFVAEIPPPLSIGTLQLADGRAVKGFLCEASVLGAATDITSFGGWRNYLASQSSKDAIASPA